MAMKTYRTIDDIIPSLSDYWLKDIFTNTFRDVFMNNVNIYSETITDICIQRDMEFKGSVTYMPRFFIPICII